MNTSTQPRDIRGRYTFKAAGAPVGTLADPWGEAAPPQPARDPMDELRQLCDQVGQALQNGQGLQSLYAATGTCSRHELVCHVGQKLLDEAYERAGITPEQVHERAQAALREQKEHEARARQIIENTVSDAVPEDVSSLAGLSWQKQKEIRSLAAEKATPERRKAVEAHERAKCPEELGELSRAYTQVLEEIRPIGGELSFTVGGTKAAQEAFNEAASFYPSNWVEASNAERPLMPRINKQRSHYVHEDVKRKTVRGLATGGGFESSAQAQAYVDFYPQHFRLAKPGEPGLPDDGTFHVVRQESRYIYGDPLTAQPPKGPGWRKESYQDSGHTLWRWVRDKNVMRTIQTQNVSEITTEHKSALTLEGQKDTTSTAVHEMAHRFEYVVPGIIQLEQEHIHDSPGFGHTDHAAYVWLGPVRKRERRSAPRGERSSNRLRLRARRRAGQRTGLCDRLRLSQRASV